MLHFCGQRRNLDYKKMFSNLKPKAVDKFEFIAHHYLTDQTSIKYKDDIYDIYFINSC